MLVYRFADLEESSPFCFASYHDSEPCVDCYLFQGFGARRAQLRNIVSTISYLAPTLEPASVIYLLDPEELFPGLASRKKNPYTIFFYLVDLEELVPDPASRNRSPCPK
jgi:hypothetical protein